MPVLEDRENFQLDPLDRYVIGQEMVEHCLSGTDAEEMRAVYQASGMLPHGTVGDIQFRDLYQDVDQFVTRLNRIGGGLPKDTFEIKLNLSDYMVEVKLDAVDRIQGLVRYRFVNVKPKDLISSWIDHLLLCAVAESEFEKMTTLICRDSVWKFTPVSESVSILDGLLSRYWNGMSKPLPFFPDSGYAYANDIIKKQKAENDALRSAHNRWRGSDFIKGESEDPYFRRCFGKTDPMDEQFKTISLEIFKPMFESLTRITGS
jgi:exodeoxyribonuclease V gamma subunit